MKKQSLSAILLSTTLLATGFVSSCKDNDADTFTDLDRQLAEQSTLRQQLATQIETLEERIISLEAKKECACNISDEWKAILESGDFATAWNNSGLKDLYLTADTLQDYATIAALAEYAKVSDLSQYATKAALDAYAKNEDLKQALDSALNEAQKARDYADSLFNSQTISASSLDSAIVNSTVINQYFDTISITISEVQQAASAAQSSADNAQKAAVTADSTAQEALRIASDTTALHMARLAQADATTALKNIAEVTTKMDSTFETIQNDIKKLNSSLETLNSTLNTVSKTATDAKIKADAADAKAEALSKALVNTADSLRSELRDSISQVRHEADSLYSELLKLAQDTATNVRIALESTIAEVRDELSARVTANEEAIAALQTAVDANTEKIEELSAEVAKITALEEAIEDLKNDLDNVKNDVDSLVTGILIQGASDPVFGYMALPLGIQTNILAGYYGDALVSGVEFPTVKTADYVDATQALTDAELAAVGGFNAETLSDDIISAGKVYVTINPTNIDFTGRTLTLKTSTGRASVVQLTNLKKSDTELSFGYTRAASTGFYEADAYILPEDAAEAAPSIDLSSLKSVAKDALNEKTFNLSNTLSAVYSAVKSFNLPRYALTHTWTNSKGEDVAVYSQFDMAATAIKPLSYNFLYGKEFNRIPTIDPNIFSNLVDRVTGDIEVSFEIDSIDFNITLPDFNLTINWDSLAFSESGAIDVAFQYTVPSYDVKMIYDENGDIKEVELIETEGTIKNDTAICNVSQIYSTIQAKVNGKIQSLVDSINSEFKGQLSQLKTSINDLNKLQTQINDMLESMQSQLNTKVNDIIATIKDDLVINNTYITRISNVINRVSSWIKNPNSKLQPVIIYKTGSGSGAILSSAKGLPSQFKLSGSGDQAIDLIATSYNAEFLAPAYKKHIAVVNVFNGAASAQNGDATCKAALKLANEAEYFNQVLDGSQRGVCFTTNSAYAGYTYEIAYSAIDYAGKMVTRRFYVKVVK